jgi:tetrahydromethanopterin S-methyltransferase subunit G
MSDDAPRATVALVLERLESQKQLMRAEFGAVNSRLDRIDGLPERVVRLEEQMKKQMDDSSRRSNVLPGIAIGVIALLIAIVNMVVLFPHG